VVLHFRPVDGPRLVPDGEYVVFAHRLDAFGRYQFNLPVDPVGGEDALGANILADRPSPHPTSAAAGACQSTAALRDGWPRHTSGRHRTDRLRKRGR
jgi:hypothetical protein